MTQITLDIAHITVLDPNHYDNDKTNDEKFLLEKATDSFNNLFSQIQALPLNINNSSRHDLPKEIISLPRENPIPPEKPKTRWEQFVKEKGLKFQPKENKIFDERTGEWRLRADRTFKKEEDWVIEVPNGTYEDPFEKRDNARKEASNEQKKRERRNKLRAQRALIDHHRAASASPSKGAISPKGNHRIETLKEAIKTSSHPGSSASMNQFNKVPNKPAIFEEGSKTPKIIDRNVGKKKGRK
ncbi:Rhodanese- sulfurtransferase [Tritrichomonas musculus]|uniref:Ribosome biogenesis regulatory protein n=1 Tax=Tritrichomonas musculus TaxID=1915356 RepID=A0ABR2KHC8_9EUKA